MGTKAHLTNRIPRRLMSWHICQRMGMLTVKKNGNNLVVEDNTGTVANISTYDVSQANGVIHVIDRVLMPGS